MKLVYKTLLAALFLITVSPLANATTWTVSVQNFSFTGNPTTVTVGDTIIWNWVNGTHNTTSTSVPAGAATWASPITMSSPTYMYVVTTPGVYEYVCTFHVGSMSESFTAIGGPCPFTAEITPTNLIMCPNTIDTLFAFPTGGTYQWLMNGSPIPGATNQFLEVSTVDALMPFNVQVTVDGCTDESEAVTYDSWVFLLPFVIHEGDQGFPGPNGEANLCTGDTLILTLGQPYTENIQWVDANGPIPGANGQSLFITETGSYSVSGAPEVCPNYVQSLGLFVDVIVHQPVLPTISQSNDTLFAQPAATDYQWFMDGNVIPGATNSFYVPTTNGNYSVVTTDVNQCQGESEPFAFQGVGCPFNAEVAPSTLVLCPNSSDTLFALPAGGTYQWFKDGALITDATNPFYEVNAFDDAGFSFNVAVTIDGCTDTSESVLIDSWLFLPPAVSQSSNGWIDVNGVTNICAGDTLTLTLLPPYDTNIQWFNGGAPIDDANDNVFYATSSGSYTVSGAPSQCPNYIQTMNIAIDVNVNIPIVPTITQSNDTLFANPQVAPYTWFFNGSPIVGQTDFFFVPTNAGLYNVMMEDANQCSGISAPFAFGLVDTCSWEPTIAPGNLALCPNSGDTLFASPIGGGYQWYKDGVPVPGALSNFLVVNSNNLGTYHVIVAFDGCIDTSETVSVDALVFLPLSVLQDTAGYVDNGVTHLCTGDTLTLTVLPPYDTNIQWFNNGSIISGATNASIQVFEAGMYNVEAAPSQCPNFTQTLGAPIPVVTHATATPVITMVNDTLHVLPQGSGFQWYLDGTAIAGATNSFYVPTSAGNYTVSMNDENQCYGVSEPFIIESVETLMHQGVRVYPNPVRDVLFVDYVNSGNVTYRVTDAIGRVVLQGKFENRISLHDIADGVYTLTLTSPKHRDEHAVFVKE